MVINYRKNYEEMSDMAAEFVAGEIKAKPDFVLGLPTGSTPLGMYSKLIEKNKAGKVDFSKVKTFNLDEYYPIKRDNSQSYYKFMFENFFGRINIRPENINIPDGEAADPDSECGRYDQKIADAGGIGLMVLGIGANGHIGFNEPGDFLIPQTHAAVLTEETRQANKRFFASIDEVPVKALTMGMGSIIAMSKKILLLVSGESKTEAFKKFLEGKITAKNPATFLYLHNDVTVISDLSN
jgi:glucosamine-6-phosphate deaminase